MCGIVGYLHNDKCIPADIVHSNLQRMVDSVASRGPDDFGLWCDESGIAMAHRRLAILDLSPAGHQPMSCHSGRYVMVFNGEIYNHLDLRRQMQSAAVAPNWHGHSDTETLLAGFRAWGIRSTIERCIGMFAFAVWDKVEEKLVLGRDRMGEKPLYYGWQGQGRKACFLFGSELKALQKHPAFNADINRDALCLLLRHSYVPAPHSIYNGIYKLPPGHLLYLANGHEEPVLEAYWSLPEMVESWVASPFTGNEDSAIDELEILLKSAVRQQMMADVPLGAFLSGGIDSSTIVALMQIQSDRPVKTFSIGFDEPGYNEAIYAKAVASHLGTEHTELYVTSKQAMDVIPSLPSLYSEPFSDSSQIPTFLVSQLARRQVKVALSGDAGDELFSGYNRYVMTRNLWGKIGKLPHGLRSLGAKGITVVSPSAWNSLLDPLQPLLPSSLRMANSGDKLHKAASVLTARNIDELYLGLVTHWEPHKLVIGGQEPLTHLRGIRLTLAGLDDVQRMMALDAITYLPDDILVKVDRATMGVSLEGRVPFLDHRVIEFAWRLPQHLKLRGGVGKWILRQVLYRHVPKELIERPKMGFGVPIDSWLRGPLRDWAESLLDENRLRQEGFFEVDPIQQKWKEHLSGQRNWQHHLWDVLMFQAWLSDR